MATATQCPSVSQLRAFSLGELTEQESNDLFQHVQQCPVCKTELETVEDAEDSLISSLRSPDALAVFDGEADCKVAVAKALGALAHAGEAATNSDLVSLPDRIGEYEIIRPLGRGGMGSVYLAGHTKLGRQVALKVVAGHRLADPRMRERFESEMRAIGRLSHPNIVTAHDAREVDGTAVLVTEYIDGLDLGEIVARTGALSVADACEITRKVAAALQYTSDQGFVHRDVKPSNIMLSTDGEVKLLDLGLARLQLDEHDRAEITGTGQTMGTADYVAPEQISDSRSVDVRADIYSLGCTLFKLLTGHAPFTAPNYVTAFAKMTAHVSDAPPDLGEVCPNTPVRLAKLVDAMLAKNPGDRPQTPIDVATQLERWAGQADLRQLAGRATAASRSDASNDSSAPPVATSPWFRKPIPLWTAIGAGFFGLVAGLILGIVIKITYPDGTEVEIPLTPGSKVEFQEVPGGGTAGLETPAMTVPDDTATKNPNANHQVDLVYSPLAFAVLVGENDLTPDQVNAAKEKLRITEGKRIAVPTQVGTWYRVADEVAVPISQSHQGQRYALVTDDRGGAITWDDLEGHIVSVQKDRNLILRFDDELAKRMEEVTGNNLHRQLAVLISKRIISAPFIRSKLTNAAVISGNFTHEESMFLFQAIQGGLVPPLKHTTEAALAPKKAVGLQEQLQGMWMVVSVVDNRGEKLDVRGGMLLIHQDRFFFLQEGNVDSTALGNFDVKSEGDRVWIEFDYVVKEQSDGKVMSWAQVSPNGELVLRHMATNKSEPPALLMRLRKLGDFPVSGPEFLGQLAHGNKGRVSPPGADAMGQVFRFLQDGKLTARQRQLLTQSLVVTQMQTKTRNNLKHIGIAFHHFASKYRKFPGTDNRHEGAAEVDPTKGTQPFSWRVALLPFLDQSNLYERYRFDEPWNSDHNIQLLEKMPEVYRSPFAPEDQPAGHTNYQGFAMEDSALGHSFRDLTDGTSNTLLLIESVASVPWTKPQDLTEIPPFFVGQPIHFLMADGSVHQKDKIDEVLLKKLITRNGGELIEW